MSNKKIITYALIGLAVLIVSAFAVIFIVETTIDIFFEAIKQTNGTGINIPNK